MKFKHRCGAPLAELTNDRYRRPGATCRKPVKIEGVRCHVHTNHTNGSE